MTTMKANSTVSRFGNVNTKLHRLYKRSFKKDIDSLGFFDYPADIICGGVISPAAYGRQPKRLVIVLKEGWAENDEKWDWPSAGRQKIQRLRNGKTTGTAWNLVHTMGAWGYLVSSMNKPKEGQHIKKYCEIRREEKAYGLEVVGVTNVKKCYGGRTSTDKDIRKWGRYTKEIWLQELELMQPSVVLCGGQVVYDVLAAHLDCDQEYKVLSGGKEFRYTYCSLGRGKQSLLVELPHPSRSASLSCEVLAQLKRQGIL